MTSVRPRRFFQRVTVADPTMLPRVVNNLVMTSLHCLPQREHESKWHWRLTQIWILGLTRPLRTVFAEMPQKVRIPGSEVQSLAASDRKFLSAILSAREIVDEILKLVSDGIRMKPRKSTTSYAVPSKSARKKRRDRIYDRWACRYKRKAISGY